MTQLVSPALPALVRVTQGLILPLGPSAQPGGGYLVRAAGGVYTHDGAIVLPSTPKRPDSIYFENTSARLDGFSVRKHLPCAIYGGVIFDHFGHFLVETMARLWVLDHGILRDAPIIFHAPPNYTLKSWQISVFRALGVFERVVLCDTPMDVDHLVVPEAAFHYSQWANAAFVTPFERIARRAGTRRSAKRLYISRAQLGNSQSIPEEELEDLFRSDGYDIVYPETLPFDEQVALFSSHELFCGISGSAMHNVLFAPRGASVTYINRFKTIRPTFRIIDELKGLKAHYILGYSPMSPEPTEPPDPVRLDLEAIYQELRASGTITVTRHWTPAEVKAYDQAYRAAAYKRRAEKHRWSRRYTEAIAACDLGLSLVDNDPGLLLEKANSVRYLEGNEAALDICTTALRHHPDNEELLQAVLDWGNKSVDADRFRELVAVLRSKPDRSSHSRFLIAKWHFDDGDIQTCLSELSDVTRENVRTHVLRARCLIKTGQIMRGLDELKRALNLENENSSVLHQISSAYEALGDFDSAYVFGTMAAESSPADKGLSLRAERLRSQLFVEVVTGTENDPTQIV